MYSVILICHSKKHPSTEAGDNGMAYALMVMWFSQALIITVIGK